MANYVSANALAGIVSSKHRITKVECRQIVDLIFQSIAVGLRTGTERASRCSEYSPAFEGRNVWYGIQGSRRRRWERQG